VALRWRRLTCGTEEVEATTLVACSGGADSTALLLALALATRRLVVAHVVHDLRPRPDTLADRDAVQRLAERLKLPFVEAELRVVGTSGNVEANARRVRYKALAELARSNGCAFVATAHHADDQLETLLMALLRGCGPKGLRGIAPKRRLHTSTPEHTITLIRPMLGVTRAEARAVCTAAGVAWREDATNADTTRLRAAIRASVLPILVRLRPESPRRAARAAELLRGALPIIETHVDSVFGDGNVWSRGALRAESAFVIGAGLRRAASQLLDGRRADRLSSRLVADAVRAIRDESTEPRTFHWTGGITLRVTARTIEMALAP
jgi:tRNA(Ile)-lysidine synthase